MNEPSSTGHRGWALLLGGLALAATAGGLTSLGLGIHCYTQPNPGADCAVLTAAVPLTTWPLAAAAAIFAAGLAGRLIASPPLDHDAAEPDAIDARAAGRPTS